MLEFDEPEGAAAQGALSDPGWPEAEFGRITEECWTSVAGLGIQKQPKARPLDRESNLLTICVQITGSWEGAVILVCPERLARQVAAVMFEMDCGQLAIDEVQDALGEMTNVISGNVKTLLPPDCRLSVPAVVEGSDYTLRVPGTRVVKQAFFVSEGHPLRVTLVRQDGPRLAVRSMGWEA